VLDVAGIELPAVEVIWVFLLASTALGIAPGPDNIFVLAQASQHGARAGVLVTLGLCTGLIVHTTLVAVGVAALFQSSEIAFTGLKMVGATYLLYLAWQAFRASASTELEEKSPSGRLYVRGVMMNITNPKVAIFFLAFLPQFANPDLGSVSLQIVMYGLIFIVVTLFVFGSIAITAGRLGHWLRRSITAQLWLNRVAGLVFVGLALRLLSTER
jgi:threonine/homoserine/homoserine lactone efflux protein